MCSSDLLVDDGIQAVATGIIHDLAGRVVEEESSSTEEGDDESEGEDHDIAADLPSSAGCLSPRIPGSHVGVPGCSKSLLEPMNIDQLAVLEQDIQPTRSRAIRAKFPSDRELRSVKQNSQNSFHCLSND